LKKSSPTSRNCHLLAEDLGNAEYKQRPISANAAYERGEVNGVAETDQLGVSWSLDFTIRLARSSGDN